MYVCVYIYIYIYIHIQPIYNDLFDSYILITNYMFKYVNSNDNSDDHNHNNSTNSYNRYFKDAVHPFFESDTLLLECLFCVGLCRLAILRIEGGLTSTL